MQAPDFGSITIPSQPGQPGGAAAAAGGAAAGDDYEYECGSIFGLQCVYEDNDARRSVVTAVDTLVKVVGNVVKNPTEAKFRRMNKSTNTYTKKIAPVPLAEDLLGFCGFLEKQEADGTEVLLMASGDDAAEKRCQTAFAELQVFRNALQKQCAFTALFGDRLSFVGADANAPMQTVNTLSGLAGSYVGIYFSASWCPPCKQFTPILANTFQNIRASGKPFQIVFVSSDKDEADYEEYTRHQAEIGGSWFAVPWQTVEAQGFRDNLSRMYGVKGIPHFVLLSPDGQLVCKEGRNAVMQDQSGMMFPWMA